MNNVILNFIEVIEKPATNLAAKVAKIFPSEVNKIYNYSVYHNDKNYTIVYHISQTEEYNTLDVGCVITNIINMIWLATKRQQFGIIAYEQPPLQILIDVMQPLVKVLSKEQYSRWNKYLSLDDIKQICNLTLCELYNKGYYIHKFLLRRALNNAIYQFLRIDNHRDYKLISIYSKQKTDEENLTVGDTICDIEQLNKLEDEENNIVIQRIFAEQRDLIIDLIGKRQYDQLLREWSTNTTSGTTQRKIFELKKRITAAGLSGDIWNKYFY